MATDAINSKKIFDIFSVESIIIFQVNIWPVVLKNKSAIDYSCDLVAKTRKYKCCQI